MKKSFACIQVLMSICAFALAFTAGCTTRDPLCANLGAGDYCIQPTTSVAAFGVQQKVSATFRGRSETIMVALEVDAAALNMAAITPFGQKLIQVNYDNNKLTATTLPDARLTPALLVAFLQLALWPADAVRAGLSPQLTLQEGSGTRRIMHNDQVVMTVDYGDAKVPPSRLHITVPAADLALDIDNLPQESQQ